MKQLINLTRTYPSAVISAVKAYRTSKPWRGTPEEKLAKLQSFHTALCTAYGVTATLTVLVQNGPSVFQYDATSITLSKFSVVTYLNAFKTFQLSHSEVLDSVEEWAVTLYVRMFPVSAARMLVAGCFIITPETAAAAGRQNLPKLADIIAEVLAESGRTSLTDPEAGDDTPHFPAPAPAPANEDDGDADAITSEADQDDLD